jgi:hypothetical protein
MRDARKCKKSQLLNVSGCNKAFLHRFVTAGASVRYRRIHGREVADVVANYVPALPPESAESHPICSPRNFA